MIPILSTSIHGSMLFIIVDTYNNAWCTFTSMFIITINTSALVHIQGHSLHPHFLGWHMELADIMSGYFILVYKHPSIQQNNQTIVIIVTNQGSYELIMVTKIIKLLREIITTKQETSSCYIYLFFLLRKEWLTWKTKTILTYLWHYSLHVTAKNKYTFLLIWLSITFSL